MSMALGKALKTLEFVRSYYRNANRDNNTVCRLELMFEVTGLYVLRTCRAMNFVM